MTCDKPDFNESVKQERRQWTQVKLADTYGYEELMEIAWLAYTNLTDDGQWKVKR